MIRYVSVTDYTCGERGQRGHSQRDPSPCVQAVVRSAHSRSRVGQLPQREAPVHSAKHNVWACAVRALACLCCGTNGAGSARLADDTGKAKGEGASANLEITPRRTNLQDESTTAKATRHGADHSTRACFRRLQAARDAGRRGPWGRRSIGRQVRDAHKRCTCSFQLHLPDRDAPESQHWPPLAHCQVAPATC